MCIRVLGGYKKRYAMIGDIITCAVKQADPRAPIKKGDVVHAVIVRQRKELRRKDGTYIRFDENAAVVIDKKNKELSLKPFVKVLSRKLKESVFFVPYEKSWLIDKKRFLAKQRESVFLFENLRFYWGEKTNDMRFAEFLAGWGDIYVNDAFPESHRKVASIAGVPKYLPSYAGFVLEREIENLGRVMKNPRRPVTLIMGGAKIVDKMDVIEYLWKKTDAVLLGGGPANTFFAAEGLPMGDSLVDENALELLSGLDLNNPQLVLPKSLPILGAVVFWPPVYKTNLPFHKKDI